MSPARRLNHPATRQWVEYYEVDSESRPDTTYIVAKSAKGLWGCSCPRWIYHRENCKHIKHVLEQISRNVAVPVVTPTPAQIKKIVSRFSLVEID